MIWRERKRGYLWCTLTLKTSLMHTNKSGCSSLTPILPEGLSVGAKGLSVGYSYSTLRNTMTTFMTMTTLMAMSLRCEGRADIPGRLSTFHPLFISSSWNFFILSPNQRNRTPHFMFRMVYCLWIMYSISKGGKEISAVGTAVDVLLECNFEILKALNTSTRFQ